MKAKSVRSQRSFTEHMKTLYQNIDTLVYAAEVACGNHDEYICRYPDRDCPWKSKMFSAGSLYACKLHSMRKIVGVHFAQHDIKAVELVE